MRERLAAGPVQVMAAHSPLAARLAEEAGFDAVWASGFELSALYGVPDASLLSFSLHLEEILRLQRMDEHRAAERRCLTNLGEP